MRCLGLSLTKAGLKATQTDVSATAQLLAERAWPSHFMLAATSMGSSCRFPRAVGHRSAWLHLRVGGIQFQSPKAHHDRHRHAPNTRPHQTCLTNITLTKLVALSHAQPCHPCSLVSYIFAARWPPNTITHSFITNKRTAKSSRSSWQTEVDECCTSVASKGHCMVYTADGAPFEVPLACLGTAVFAELLRMSREEFGFEGGDGRITLPCDAAVMEYAMCLLRRGASAELEQAFLSTMAMPRHYANQVVPYVSACC